MPVPAEIRADFDRIRNLLKVARNLSDGNSAEAESMVYEYLCVAITGKLEQNIKQVFILYSNNKSDRRMGAAISKLCQQFQNPDREKIVTLVGLFDKDYSGQLSEKWRADGSVGAVLSDMVGIRKGIAHQTTNTRTATRTKVENFFEAYRSFVEELCGRFL